MRLLGLPRGKHREPNYEDDFQMERAGPSQRPALSFGLFAVAAELFPERLDIVRVVQVVRGNRPGIIGIWCRGGLRRL